MHWRHFLTGWHFILKTDQKSLSYMSDKHHRGKITNEKFLRWRLELSCYSFDLIYRPGRDNIPPDTLSRVMCATATADSLHKLHESLWHPAVTRLSHFVRTKSLPYSLEEIKNMTSQCPVCCECNPSTTALRRFPSSRPLSYLRGSTSISKAFYQPIMGTDQVLPHGGWWVLQVSVCFSLSSRVNNHSY